MTRPHLILIPGTLNDDGLWRDQIAPLSLVAKVSIADITQGDSLDALARQVLDLASGPVILAGFSLGGLVAQEIWRIAPERVRGLALLDTTFLPDSPQSAAERDARVAAARSAPRFIGMGTRLLPRFLAPESLNKGDIAARLQAMTERLGAAVFIRQSLVPRPDNRALLASITCSVLVLCGEHDAITPPSLHEQMVALIPQARLVRVPNAGHMTPMEQPDIVTNALVHLIAQITRQD